ncbi:MAG: hypothetical protein HC910_05495 [Spirulinaceae cyanobacterium SM2_1_0]|nr:hypothetical protein [Spirulinaceae cyanobacterium SM2_1_0]
MPASPQLAKRANKLLESDTIGRRKRLLKRHDLLAQCHRGDQRDEVALGALSRRHCQSSQNFSPRPVPGTGLERQGAAPVNYAIDSRDLRASPVPARLARAEPLPGLLAQV